MIEITYGFHIINVLLVRLNAKSYSVLYVVKCLKHVEIYLQELTILYLLSIHALRFLNLF